MDPHIVVHLQCPNDGYPKLKVCISRTDFRLATNIFFMKWAEQAQDRLKWKDIDEKAKALSEL